MPKSKKSKKPATLWAKITEQNLLITLVVILLVCVGVLIFKENRTTQIDEPITIEQPSGE
jgi:cell division protein FtsL